MALTRTWERREEEETDAEVRLGMDFAAGAADTGFAALISLHPALVGARPDGRRGSWDC